VFARPTKAGFSLHHAGGEIAVVHDASEFRFVPGQH
jgi:hypothetical protein